MLALKNSPLPARSALKPGQLAISRVIASLAPILLAMVWITTHVSASPLLAGTYKITEKADLGSEIRLTVELKLLNGSDAAVTVNRVSLRTISSPGRTNGMAGAVVVQPHSSSPVSAQFMVSKKDFSVWSNGPQQQFIVQYQSAGEKPITAKITLPRTRG